MLFCATSIVEPTRESKHVISSDKGRKQTPMANSESSHSHDNVRDDAAVQRCPGPFIHKFETENHLYVYDVNTNRIVQTDEVMFELLGHVDDNVDADHLRRRLVQYPPAQVEKAISKYQHMRSKHGLFSCRRPKTLKGFDLEGETLRDYRERMQQLILELTQECNLRCKYCSYSDYYPVNRGYSRKTMPFETAKKAIDFFLEHTRGADSHAVSFYGGEPLLKSDLLASCVRYAKERLGRIEVRFSLTTNGTLITKTVLKQFKDLDIHILVSVDGPPHCHDENRVFKSGQGSAKRVFDTLRFIREFDRNYYEKNVGFTTVVAANTDPAEYYLYFRKHDDLFGTGILLPNFVDDGSTEYWCVNPVTTSWKRSLDALRWKYYESLVRGELPKDRFLQGLFEGQFLKIYKRGIFAHLPQTMNLNGCCTPGIRRLYVDCDGRFHMCERINPTLPIGDVDGGFDFGRIAEIIDEYRGISEQDCRDCWLVRFCSVCFARAVVEGGFTLESKRQQCHSVKEAFKKDLVDYCEIAEINPAAFNYMEDIVVT